MTEPGTGTYWVDSPRQAGSTKGGSVESDELAVPSEHDRGVDAADEDRIAGHVGGHETARLVGPGDDAHRERVHVVRDGLVVDGVQHHLPVEVVVSFDDLERAVTDREHARAERHGGDDELDVTHRRGKYIAAVTVRDLHTAWAWVVIVSNAAVGVWSVGAHWWAPLRVRAMWWFVIAAEAAIFVQVGLGVWMLSVQHITAPDFHTFYGFVTLISVLILFAYRNQLRANLYLLYGLGSLFLMGLGLRAVVLG